MRPTTLRILTCLTLLLASRASHAQTYCPGNPDDYIIVWGKYASGDAMELCLSDDEYLEITQVRPFSPLFPYVEVRYWVYTDAQSATSIVYSIEGRVTARVSGGQNPQTLRTYIRNYTGAWDLIDERGTNPNEDEVISHVQSENAGNYIAQDGEALVRQVVWNPGQVLSPNWGLKLDQFTVTIIE